VSTPGSEPKQEINFQSYSFVFCPYEIKQQQQPIILYLLTIQNGVVEKIGGDWRSKLVVMYVARAFLQFHPTNLFQLFPNPPSLL